MSDHGRVRSLDRYILRKSNDNRKPYLLRGKMLAFFVTASGHVTVHLARQWVYVHRLVLLTFVCAPEKYAAGIRVESRHLDGNPANNNVQNLAWGTVKENRADRRRLGEKAKFTREEALQIRQECASGQLIKDVARKWGVTRHTIARYKKGRMYGNLA